MPATWKPFWQYSVEFIAHFDIDAFYAGVAIRDDPSLRGKPVAIAGRHRRAVVLTASYEARPFGVRSAIPLYRALELCPQLIVVPPQMDRYKQLSREVFEIFSSSGRALEGLSLDEAFVDLGSVELEEAAAIAAQIRAAVFARTQLTVSAGVATGKMIAKIACDSCKPDGLLAIAPGDEAVFLAPLPVGRLWGVGPKTAARLLTFGVTTIGQVAELDDARARQLFGSAGPQMRDLARGIDSRSVETQRDTKSISSETTFEYDVRDQRKLLEIVRELSIEIADKMVREDCSASTVGVKLKGADFRVTGRQTHLREPTRDVRMIYRAAALCLRRAHSPGTPVRLVGVRVASIVEGPQRQISMFEGSFTKS
jgi:DNA polymerase IV